MRLNRKTSQLQATARRLLSRQGQPESKHTEKHTQDETGATVPRVDKGYIMVETLLEIT